jgi:RNase P subunit RPR2
MSKRGHCVDMKEEYHVNYTFVFKRDVCYHCVKLLVRTVNVLEKLESKYFHQCELLKIKFQHI